MKIVNVPEERIPLSHLKETVYAKGIIISDGSILLNNDFENGIWTIPQVKVSAIDEIEDDIPSLWYSNILFQEYASFLSSSGHIVSSRNVNCLPELYIRDYVGGEMIRQYCFVLDYVKESSIETSDEHSEYIWMSLHDARSFFARYAVFEKDDEKKYFIYKRESAVLEEALKEIEFQKNHAVFTDTKRRFNQEENGIRSLLLGGKKLGIEDEKMLLKFAEDINIKIHNRSITKRETALAIEILRCLGLNGNNSALLNSYSNLLSEHLTY